MHVGASGRQCCGGSVRAGEADDLMPRFEEFANNRRSDLSRGSGDKHTHGENRFVGSIRPGTRTATAAGSDEPAKTLAI
jgi:hypothetical protein